MKIPTVEQQAILDDPSRIRVVQAVPGSGKTWLLAWKLRETLRQWRYLHRGIAALSFTNVARDEIRDALGFVPTHPHFVGTLDSFIFRYIVKPFAYLYDPALQRVTLIPGEYAEALAEKQRWYPNNTLQIQVGPNTNTRVNVFVTNFLEEVDGNPIFAGKTAPWDPFRRISGMDSVKILAKKKDIWGRSGCVSHSDTAFLAREILSGPQGEEILTILARRFPVLIVDELQDTGWYMAQVLREILSRTHCKAILVGDPDQAIFEFGGATPQLFPRFSDLPDAKRLHMNYSRRCPRAVRQVAECLTAESRSINGSDYPGRAILAVFKGDGARDLVTFCDSCQERRIIYSLILRRNTEIANLNPGSARPKTKFGSRPLQHIHEAVRHLRGGQQARALALAEAALAQTAFKSNHMGERALQECGIDAFEWRVSLVHLLLEGHREKDDEDRYQWGLRLKDSLKNILAEKGWPEAQTPRAPTTRLRGKPVWSGEVATERRSLPCSTVHGAKGQTHKTTIFFVPEKRADRCPSVQWWIEDSEERRIAYVAATRASRAFVLCVHESVLARLRKSQPSFVERFGLCKLSDLEPDWD